VFAELIQTLNIFLDSTRNLSDSHEILQHKVEVIPERKYEKRQENERRRERGRTIKNEDNGSYDVSAPNTNTWEPPIRMA
jgi:hypothetical protein